MISNDQESKDLDSENTAARNANDKHIYAAVVINDVSDNNHIANESANAEEHCKENFVCQICKKGFPQRKLRNKCLKSHYGKNNDHNVEDVVDDAKEIKLKNDGNIITNQSEKKFICNICKYQD